MTYGLETGRESITVPSKSPLKSWRADKHRISARPQLYGDWIGCNPEGGGQDSQIGRELARKLRAEQFHLIVHDDDVFTYEYYRDGKLVDQFNSRPDYFEEVSKANAPETPRSGQLLLC